MVPVKSPLQAALGTLVVTIGNAVVAFGAFSNTTAATIESAVVGLIGVSFLVANALHHNANAKAGK